MVDLARQRACATSLTVKVAALGKLSEPLYLLLSRLGFASCVAGWADNRINRLRIIVIAFSTHLEIS